MAGKSGGLDKLSALVRRSHEPLSAEEQQLADADEEKLNADATKVLEFAEKLAGGESIFDLQILIETCAEMVRDQIREQVEGEDGE